MPRLPYVLLGLLVGLAGNATLVLAWNGPSASAPGNNISAPVNVGTTAQVKNGDLGTNFFTAFGDAHLVSGWNPTPSTITYLNFSNAQYPTNPTWGASGYGIRDNNGTLEFKNNGGAWTSFLTAVMNALSLGPVGQITFADGSVQTTASGPNSGKMYQFGNAYAMTGVPIGGGGTGFVTEALYDTANGWWVVLVGGQIGAWTTKDFDHYVKRGTTASTNLRFNAGKYFTVYSNDIYASSDGGVTWALSINCAGTFGCGYLEYLSPTNTWVTIPYGSGLKTYYTSTNNGTSWTTRTFASDPFPAGNGAGKIFITTLSGLFQSSTDGITWTTITLPAGVAIADLRSDNVRYVGSKWLAPITSQRVMVSDDAVNWSVVNVPSPGIDEIFVWTGTHLPTCL